MNYHLGRRYSSVGGVLSLAWAVRFARPSLVGWVRQTPAKDFVEGRVRYAIPQFEMAWTEARRADGAFRPTYGFRCP